MQCEGTLLLITRRDDLQNKFRVIVLRNRTKKWLDSRETQTSRERRCRSMTRTEPMQLLT